MFWEKHVKLTVKLFVLVAIFFFALPAQAKYGGGTGDPNDPYLIYTAEQMNAIGTDSKDWDKCFLLCADIDLSGFTGTSFNIIGNFTGVFDGNGHTISNFTYTSPGTRYIGLFGYVTDPNAEIKDLGLIDPDVDAGTGYNVGSLVGRNSGTITNCYVEGGSIAGTGRYVGGLAGRNYYGSITNCYAAGSVLGNNRVGGLAGRNYYGSITNCYSTGNVTGETQVGGLVGCNYNGGTITNCYSTGSVSGTSYVGGLVGSGGGAITNCYSTGSVTGGYCVGGLLGYNEAGEITDSFWDIETSGQNTSDGGTGKTTAEMQTAATFIAWASCDPDPVWTIDEGQDYPKLCWEDIPGVPIIPQLWLGGGSGTQADPYLIYTGEQLNTIGLFPCLLDKHFKLMADIDLIGFTGTSFNIIGNFTGVFDGNDHTISNFNSNRGLFGSVSGEIKDLGLIDPEVDAGTGDNVGALVGHLSGGTVTGCYAEGGSVAGDNYVGGLVGTNSGTITNCYSAASVSGVHYVGGLVGRNGSCGRRQDECYSGTISNCYSAGSVTGVQYVGGLVGMNGWYGWCGRDEWCYSGGTISNCYSTCSVSGTGSDVGGLVGLFYDGMVSNCFWDVNTSGQTTSAGGTGKMTAEMQMQITFTDAGWDFVGERINGSEDIWMMTCEGMSYPKLSWWQPVLGDYFCPDGVDMIDMEHLALHWLDTGCDESNDYCDWAEISNDRTIDFTDFAILAGNWLAGL